jgi:hypothetical protein
MQFLFNSIAHHNITCRNQPLQASCPRKGHVIPWPPPRPKSCLLLPPLAPSSLLPSSSLPRFCLSFSPRILTLLLSSRHGEVTRIKQYKQDASINFESAGRDGLKNSPRTGKRTHLHHKSCLLPGFLCVFSPCYHHLVHMVHKKFAMDTWIYRSLCP